MSAILYIQNKTLLLRRKEKMKHTIKLLTLAFTLAAILTLTGCPGPVNTVVPCTHENKKTVIETAATCTEAGLEKIICADCGELIEENTIEALGHDFGKWDVTEPIHSVTKCEDGKKVHTCSRCNKKVEEVIPVEHDFELTEHIIATCTECEKLVAVCKVCKTKITNEKPALGHSYGNWNVKEATCTTDGTKKEYVLVVGMKKLKLSLHTIHLSLVGVINVGLMNIIKKMTIR